MSKQDAMAKAEDFLENETQYRLGFITAEKPNPKTAHMDQIFSESIAEGVRVLQSVDWDLVGFAKKAFADARFEKLTNAFYRSLANQKRVVFSGCGSSGRLSILLEAAYRKYFRYLKDTHPNMYEKVADLSDSVLSIMTGGDYALIRAVEFFEDYMVFGRRQARDLAIGRGDTLVGVTATGETASILGTVMEAAEMQADVFMLICVPMNSIITKLERSAKAFEHPQVTVLDMPCGGMALTGSTRMQSSTLEMFVAGAALENAMRKLLEERLGKLPDGLFAEGGIRYGDKLRELMAALSGDENVEQISRMIGYEEEIYRQNGLVTYYATDLLLDILTDTAERPPTFSLPPFRKYDEPVSAQSWAFVKNPLLSTEKAWWDCLGRDMRCIGWKRGEYEQMGVWDRISSVPKIDAGELMKFRIGNEPSVERLAAKPNAAIWIGHEEPGPEFSEATRPYDRQTRLIIGPARADRGGTVLYDPPKTPLRLFEHIATKLVLNVISTGVMVRLGRVTGNWMSWLDISNKKLIDRSIRIISDQCGLSYRDACMELFITADTLKASSGSAQGISPVHDTIQRINRRKSMEAAKG